MVEVMRINKKSLQSLALCSLLLLPTAVSAEIWEVTVGDNFYSPNEITIQVGDTVRWSYNGSRLHDVTADDGSFASQTSSNFMYERTFNTVEEVFYHCSVHSTSGRDINVFQNGRINVVAADSVGINAGMSDAWYNPETAGQGLFLIVWEDLQQVFLSWFTYDTERPPEGTTAQLGEPGHRWLTAQGGFSGDTAVLDVFLTSGGVFDAAEPAAVTDQNPVGSIVITWMDCTSAVLSYDIPGLGLVGEIPLRRITSDNVPLCEAGQAAE